MSVCVRFRCAGGSPAVGCFLCMCFKYVFFSYVQVRPFLFLFQCPVSPKIPIDPATAAARSVMTAALVHLPTTPPLLQPQAALLCPLPWRACQRPRHRGSPLCHDRCFGAPFNDPAAAVAHSVMTAASVSLPKLPTPSILAPSTLIPCPRPSVSSTRP